jgi:hypothetical protein
LVSVPLLFKMRANFSVLLALTLLLGYFLVTVAMVGLDAYGRSRIPHTPWLCVLAGIAVVWVVRQMDSRAGWSFLTM